jgi:hypothetical protein
VRGERGGERCDVAALRADAGQQEHGVRHQLAHALEVLGVRRARHCADVGQTGRAAAGCADPGHHLGEPLPQRPAVGEHGVEHVGGTGVGRAHEHERAGPGLARALHERVQRVLAEQRVRRERVGPEAGREAEGGRRLADERLRVRGGRDGDVATLAVGEHEQAGAVRVRAHRLQREPAREAEALEAGELRLDGDARRPRGVDERRAVREHGGGGLDARRRARGARERAGRGGAGTDRARPRRRAEARGLLGVGELEREVSAQLSGRGEHVAPQVQRVGIDPEDDLRLARRHGGGDPVTERDGARRRPVPVPGRRRPATGAQLGHGRRLLDGLLEA